MQEHVEARKGCGRISGVNSAVGCARPGQYGWQLSLDSWENQELALASDGYRVVMHDRRCHGRASQPRDGSDMDHYGDDLAQLIESLDLRDVSLCGFSTGGDEIALRRSAQRWSRPASTAGRPVRRGARGPRTSVFTTP